jgi:hypothetical protein
MGKVWLFLWPSQYERRQIMARQPNFVTGDWVTYEGMMGKIIKVWTTNPNNIKYTVKFNDGNRVLREGALRRT